MWTRLATVAEVCAVRCLDLLLVGLSVCVVCVRVCVRACVMCVCVRACVCVC